MADKLFLPLGVPGPRLPCPVYQGTQTSSAFPPTTTSTSSPLSSRHKKFTRHQPYSPPSAAVPSDPLDAPAASSRIDLGKFRGPYKGKRRSKPIDLSSHGRQALESLLDSSDEVDLDKILPPYFGSEGEFLLLDLAAVLKGLDVHNRRALALRVFGWVRQRHGDARLFPPDDYPIARTVITILGKEGRLAEAADLLASLREQENLAGITNCAANGYTYDGLMEAYSKNKCYKQVLAVFQQMQGYGVRPTRYTYNMVLGAYHKLYIQWPKIVALLEAMKRDRVEFDRHTYTILIRCCRNGSLHDAAAKIMNEMKAAGFIPDKVTYVALLDVYSKSGRHAEAMELVREMETNGFPADIIIYSILISGYAGAGSMDEAVELKEQMEAKGILPNAVTYNTLLSGFVKVGKGECAVRMFNEMRSKGCAPNIDTYNVLIKMRVNRGKLSEMMRVFEELRDAGHAPDKITWTTLLPAIGRNGMEAEVSAVLEETDHTGFVPEKLAYATLIRACIHHGLIDQAISVYKRMPATVGVDLSTYNACLEALSCRGLWEQAEKILAEMKDGRCKPDEFSYCQLLRAYANSKEVRRMQSLASEMFSQADELSAMTLKTLVAVYSKSNLLYEAEQAFSELRRRGFSPDSTTLNAMISIYAKKRMVARVISTLHYIKEIGGTPDLTTCHNLMCMYSYIGELETVEEILKEILSSGFRLNRSTYDTLFIAYARLGRMKDASRILSEMKAAGFTPNAKTYHTFLPMLDKDG